MLAPLLIIRGHDAGNGGQEDGVAAHKRQEIRSRRDDAPRHKHPGADHGGHETATADVEVAREEHREVVGRRDGVGRDAGARLRHGPRKAAEKGRCAPTAGAALDPVAIDRQRVLDQLAVDDGRGRRADDADEYA